MRRENGSAGESPSATDSPDLVGRTPRPAAGPLAGSLWRQAKASAAGESPTPHSRRRRGQRGLTLVELIVAFSIMLILTTMAVPLAKSRVRAERERDLRRALDEMHKAIDKYKDNCDQGFFGPPKVGTNCYPESLEILVEGVKLAQSADGKKLRFLRRVPNDPFSGKPDWGMRSDQDDPKSTSWGGQNVFAVYSKTTDKAPDGTLYSEW